MLRALSAAVSGLRTNQAALDVIGNNIANVNTLGFKASQTEFADLLSQTIAGEQAPASSVGGKDAMQIGLGSTVGAIRTLFTQGVVQSTNNPSDLAIQGEVHRDCRSSRAGTRSCSRCVGCTPSQIPWRVR